MSSMARLAAALLCAGLIASVPGAASACPPSDLDAEVDIIEWTDEQSCRERRRDRELAAVAGISGGLLAFALGRRWKRRPRPNLVP
jgi:hypothetical protein